MSWSSLTICIYVHCVMQCVLKFLTLFSVDLLCIFLNCGKLGNFNDFFGYWAAALAITASHFLECYCIIISIEKSLFFSLSWLIMWISLSSKNHLIKKCRIGHDFSLSIWDENDVLWMTTELFFKVKFNQKLNWKSLPQKAKVNKNVRKCKKCQTIKNSHKIS